MNSQIYSPELVISVWTEIFANSVWHFEQTTVASPVTDGRSQPFCLGIIRSKFDCGDTLSPADREQYSISHVKIWIIIDGSTDKTRNIHHDNALVLANSREHTGEKPSEPLKILYVGIVYITLLSSVNSKWKISSALPDVIHRNVEGPRKKIPFRDERIRKIFIQDS